MKTIKNYFKNRKTLKYKSLIFWGYIFFTYLILRPPGREQLIHILISENFTNFYIKFPVIIYWIILVAILIEFIKIWSVRVPQFVPHAVSSRARANHDRK